MGENYNFPEREIVMAFANRVITDEGECIRGDVLLHKTQEKFLQLWNHDDGFFRAFRRLTLPLCHKGAEQIVRKTLLLPPKEILTATHIRRSVVMAMVTPLRQTIGSCFATAPAILIQEQQPERLLADLTDLLLVGSLKRVVAGTEVAVPLSIGALPSPGNPLLKAWEYTLASLTEVKPEFSLWNLYLSLGFRPDERGGIGECLYQIIDTWLHEANRKMEEYHQEAVRAMDALRAVESHLASAQEAGRIRQLRAEAIAKHHHMQTCVELRDRSQQEAKFYSLFFSSLLDEYGKQISDDFQEIYDPDMAEAKQGAYDDQPAGFRLVYKHGRRDPLLWTPIRNGDEFVSSLVQFFVSTETKMASSLGSPLERERITEVTTQLIQYLRSPIFLDASVERMARLGRTPWSYASGGTMEGLVCTYYGREPPLVKEERWVDGPADLLVFLLDTLKAISSEVFEAHPERALLMQSPTHAFLLKPQEEPIRRGMQSTGFTYTWIRDEFIVPARNFYTDMRLSPGAQRWLTERLGVPFSPREELFLREFVQKFPGGASLGPLLFEILPILSKREAEEALRHLVAPWCEGSTVALSEWTSSSELRRLATQLLAHLPMDAHGEVGRRARALSLASPCLLFADTNWESWWFSFVVDPVTLELQLWRTDRWGLRGEEMREWRPYMNGEKKIPWVIYTNPAQYGG